MPDADAQERFVGTVNKPLASAGVRLAPTAESDGYPVFTIAPISGGVEGKPKNIIFASSVKPDLRFRDAINNDIEIVTEADKVLIFDQPIPHDGLKWSVLQEWWAERNSLSDQEAKASLYRRLLSALPHSSPPQRTLFESFFEHFRSSVPLLPALLPEVWLHFDPVTVTRRGREALFRQRMDFLLLLPQRRRIVIEVDGLTHYAVNGRPDPETYARTMRADRELRLLGYDVYRFGATDLTGTDARAIVAEFFDDLFKLHGLV